MMSVGALAALVAKRGEGLDEGNGAGRTCMEMFSGAVHFLFKSTSHNERRQLSGNHRYKGLI